MNKLVYMFSVLSLVLIMQGCKDGGSQNANANGSYESLAVADFAKIIGDSDVQLLDVRTSGEYMQGNIDGSVNIDIKEEYFNDSAACLLDKSRCVAVYCRSGRRSKIAASRLVEMGFKVVELDKGYNAWVEDAGK